MSTAAGAFAAIGVGIATLFLTPLLFYMPKTALAAIIMANIPLALVGAVIGLKLSGQKFGEVMQRS